jgi:hypothetical protein
MPSKKDLTRRGEAGQGKTRHGYAGAAGQDKAWQGRARARQGKTGQDRARQGKAKAQRQDEHSRAESTRRAELGEERQSESEQRQG